MFVSRSVIWSGKGPIPISLQIYELKSIKIQNDLSQVNNWKQLPHSKVEKLFNRPNYSIIRTVPSLSLKLGAIHQICKCTLCNPEKYKEASIQLDIIVDGLWLNQ